MDEVRRLVEELRPSVRDHRVLQALAQIPREEFVLPDQRHLAYENQALPIDCGQTISQPLMIVRMLDLLALRDDDYVLDVGTGSGYHAALLSRLAGRVLSVELYPDLAARARERLSSLGITNVEVVAGDGAEGLPERGPYDAINVAAAAEQFPSSLEQQLAPGGRLVAPVGRADQRLVLCIRTPRGIRRRTLEKVRFVPLVREQPEA